MEFLKLIVQIVNVLSAVVLIVLVLMQHGKGADMGAAFGSGASGSLFGAAGSANFLSRATAISALVFFSTCMGLVALDAKKPGGLGVMESHVAPAKPAAPSVAPKPTGIPE
ncbi:preprotein translocase subunit SecG [Chitinivorax sp. B]|uniref:preprotein translocase subunit SecG n=1 Tax=Chitinivorax sp. B TaxID=2502235 RepID=UPI0010F92FB5|nr:preprotein translocase subunit SecG [Chitinivorax sp. B]